MTKRELLESYGFDGVPEEEQDKYMRHIVDTLWGASPRIDREPKQDLSDVDIQFRLADALRKSRELTDVILGIAEEVCDG